MLEPFEHRDTWQRLQDWDGETAGKWLDAAVLSAASSQDEQLVAAVEEFANELRATQEDDGYLGTELPQNRLRASWPLWMHWYAMTALLAHARLFDDPLSLECAVRCGDWLIGEFSPVREGSAMFEGANQGAGSMAVLDQIVTLYFVTGEVRFLDFANDAARCFPPLKQMLASGKALPYHAYSMLTYLGGYVLLAQANKDESQLAAIERVWQEIADNHLFPTGSLSTNECLNVPPTDLVNGHLQETCATVEWLIFTHRLLLATGNVQYANALELTVNNALLGAQSVDGTKWTYFTPLQNYKSWLIGPTNCCYFSGPRGIAKLPELIYHVDAGGCRVDLFESSTAQLNVLGHDLRLTQESSYPKIGQTRISMTMEGDVDFALSLRIPQHVTNTIVALNGVPLPVAAASGEYAEISRSWASGDTVDVTFDMVTHTHRLSDGSVVISRGAEVLCADLRDNPGLRLDEISTVPRVDVASVKTSCDGRRVYSAQAIVNGNEQPIMLTPFAESGNLTPGVLSGGASYRTAFRE
jgi:hypothetical protein